MMPVTWASNKTLLTRFHSYAHTVSRDHQQNKNKKDYKTFRRYKIKIPTDNLKAEKKH